MDGAEQPPHRPLDLQLALVRRQVDRTGEPRGGGHVGEQGVDRRRADDGEHLGAVGVGKGEVAHHSVLKNCS